MKKRFTPTLLAEAYEPWRHLAPLNPFKERRPLLPVPIRVHWTFASDYARRNGRKQVAA